jgi:hypothetical protein
MILMWYRSSAEWFAYYLQVFHYTAVSDSGRLDMGNAADKIYAQLKPRISDETARGGANTQMIKHGWIAQQTLILCWQPVDCLHRLGSMQSRKLKKISRSAADLKIPRECRPKTNI